MLPIPLLLQLPKADSWRIILNLARSEIIHRVVIPQKRGANKRKPILSAIVKRRHTLVARPDELISTDAERDVVLLGILSQCEGQCPRGIEVLAIHPLFALQQLCQIPAKVEVHSIEVLIWQRNATRTGVEHDRSGTILGPRSVGSRPHTFSVRSIGHGASLHDNSCVFLTYNQDINGPQRRAPELVWILFSQWRIHDFAVNVLLLFASADSQDTVLLALIGEIGAVEQAEPWLIELAVPEQCLNKRRGVRLSDTAES